MPTGFEKIIALIRRTGDRCIVVDAVGNPAYVVLPLDEYEHLVLSRRGADVGVPRVAPLLEAIDRAVANAQPTEATENPPAVESSPPEGGSGIDVGDQYFFEPIE